MSRASTVYVLMFVLLGLGLWAILDAGSRLVAPVNLAGTWKITAMEGDRIPQDKWISFQIQQSGKYLRIQIGTEPPADFKLVEERIDPDGAVTATLRNASGDVQLFGQPQLGVLQFSRNDYVRFAMDLQREGDPPASEARASAHGPGR